MSNKDWAEVAAEAAGRAASCACHPFKGIVIAGMADAIRTALAGYVVIERERLLQDSPTTGKVFCRICNGFWNKGTPEIHVFNDCPLAPQERT